MSKAPAGIVEQAHRLVAAARLLPADEAAQALEQVAIVMQAAQAEVLVAAERSGEITDSGCRTVRSFAGRSCGAHPRTPPSSRGSPTTWCASPRSRTPTPAGWCTRRTCARS